MAVIIATGVGHRRLGGLSGLLFVAVHLGVEMPHMIDELAHSFAWVTLAGAIVHWGLDGFFFYHEWRHDRRATWLIAAIAACAAVAAISFLTHDHSHHGHAGYLSAVIAGGIVGCAGFHLVMPFVSKKGCSH